MKTIATLSIAAAAFAGAIAAPASAAVTYNANLAAPGVYYGSGNSNGAFTINTVDGVELGLRGHVYQQNPGTPVGNVYSFNLGETISFDWSFNPGADGSQLNLNSVSNWMLITNVGTGANFLSPPDFFLWGNDTDPGAPGGYQNSWRLEFGFLGLGYDKNANATYTVDWAFSSAETGAINNRIVLVQGAGAGAVPEPASWAMLIAGFAVVGSAMRRRAAKVSFA